MTVMPSSLRVLCASVEAGAPHSKGNLCYSFRVHSMLIIVDASAGSICCRSCFFSVSITHARGFHTLTDHCSAVQRNVCRACLRLFRPHPPRRWNRHHCEFSSLLSRLISNSFITMFYQSNPMAHKYQIQGDKIAALLKAANVSMSLHTLGLRALH